MRCNGYCRHLIAPVKIALLIASVCLLNGCYATTYHIGASSRDLNGSSQALTRDLNGSSQALARDLNQLVRAPA